MDEGGAEREPIRVLQRNERAGPRDPGEIRPNDAARPEVAPARDIPRPRHSHRPLAYRLREACGAYFNDELGPTVMLAKGLPDDPMVFTMAHELKHHLVDREIPVACCSDRNANQHIEIGAEIFAAELIFPEQDFVECLTRKGIASGECTPEAIVHLKRETHHDAQFHRLGKASDVPRVRRAGYFRWCPLEEVGGGYFGEPLYKVLLRRAAAEAHGRRNLAIRTSISEE